MLFRTAKIKTMVAGKSRTCTLKEDLEDTNSSDILDLLGNLK